MASSFNVSMKAAWYRQGNRGLLWILQVGHAAHHLGQRRSQRFLKRVGMCRYSQGGSSTDGEKLTLVSPSQGNVLRGHLLHQAQSGAGTLTRFCTSIWRLYRLPSENSIEIELCQFFPFSNALSNPLGTDGRPFISISSSWLSMQIPSFMKDVHSSPVFIPHLGEQGSFTTQLRILLSCRYPIYMSPNHLHGHYICDIAPRDCLPPPLNDKYFYHTQGICMKGFTTLNKFGDLALPHGCCRAHAVPPATRQLVHLL
jgi:hypothetical protein